ncbi:MAG: sodium:solute symporter [Verrucomicrobiota bacterium]
MDSQLRTFDLGVLVVYMAGVFAMGCWFAKRSGSTSEFMAAGRSLPGWVVGLSIFGTYFSSISFLGMTGKSFGGNWNSWVFGLSLPIAALVAVRYFVPLYRGGDSISAYAHLEDRFGPWARTYALICYLLSQLARMGTILYLVALALAPLTGWDVKSIILFTGVMVTIYTLLGGIEAVIWTDVVQSIVLVVGVLFCGFLIVTSLPGGAGQLFEVAREHDKFSLGSFDLGPMAALRTEPTFWIVLVYGFFINLQNFGVDQSFVQRYLTAKSDRAAKSSVWMGALLFPVVSAVLFFVGTGLFALYEAKPELLEEVKVQVAETRLIQEGREVNGAAVAEAASGLSAVDVGDKVLPHFIVNELPMGLAGLLIAAIFAAAMSSMDTSLNSSATLVLCDLYKRYVRPGAGERESMKVLHSATFVFGVLGTVTAVAMIRVKSALDAWWNLQGIFTGGVLGLFLLGLISKRARNAQAILAVSIGIFLILWLSLSTTGFWPEAWARWRNPLHSFLTIVLGTTTIVLVGTLAARWAGRAERRENL